MKRRTFLKAGVAAVGASAVAADEVRGAEPASGELYRLGTIKVRPERQAALDEYLGTAFIPAVKRAGCGPVGVFTESNSKDGPKTFVLVVHPDANSVVTIRQALGTDQEFQAAAKDFMAARPTNKIVDHMDGSLLVPISGMPRLEKPDTSKPRIFNLRIYRSHNERAAAKKVEMFNVAELAIFRRVGLTPVFFASTIVGADLPNLTYMLVFPDDAARQAAWGRFGKDAEWQKLRSKPEYADKELISEGITNRILTPTSYSEV
jgi:hypothetical protein